MKKTHCEPAKYTYEQRKLLPDEAQRLGKLLSILFWLFIPSGIADIMTSNNMSDLAPAIFITGNILRVACSVIYGIILLQMACAEIRYRFAGIFSLLYSVVTIPIIILSIPVRLSAGTLIFSIIQTVFAFAFVYTEYTAHASLLSGTDDNLSRKWSCLWKWYFGSNIVIFCSLFFMLVSPILGILLFLVSGIALIVISILKLVYLYRTAKIFRSFPSGNGVREKNTD